MHGFNQAPVLLCFAVALAVQGHALPPRDAFLVGRQASSSDATSSSSAAPSSSSSGSSTPYILFSSVSSLTTCSPASINWVYVGPSDTMSLTITNRGVSQGAAPASSSIAINTMSDGITETTLVELAVPTGASVTSSASQSTATVAVTEKIVASVDPYVLTYNWSSVNVPEGWYRLVATIDTSISQSDAFYVSNGPDTSCILLASSSSSTTSSATSTPTTSSAANASGATGNSSGSKVNKGAIAGGVIGGVALLAAIIAVFVNYRLCRPASATGSPRSPRRSKGAWGGLGSVDTTYSSRSASQTSKSKSNAYAAGLGMGAGARGDKHRSQSDSIGPILESQTNMNNPNPNSEVLTPGNSNEDVNSINLSPFEEKFAVNDAVDPFSGTDPIAALPVARPNNARQSSGSTSSGNQNTHHNINRESQTYAPNNNFSRPRSTSDHQLKSPRRVSVDYSKYPGLDLTPTNPSRNDYPPCPPMSAPMSRSSSGGARRTPRKPVPAYTPDISQSYAAHAPSPARARAHTTRDYTAPDMPSDVSFIATASDADGSSVRSGRSARSGRSGTTASHTHAAGMPEMNHKSSFGDMRPVHYLIPDMPPPNR